MVTVFPVDSGHGGVPDAAGQDGTLMGIVINNNSEQFPRIVNLRSTSPARDLRYLKLRPSLIESVNPTQPRAPNDRALSVPLSPPPPLFSYLLAMMHRW